MSIYVYTLASQLYVCNSKGSLWSIWLQEEIFPFWDTTTFVFPSLVIVFSPSQEIAEAIFLSLNNGNRKTLDFI
ncbi:hypothetical protein L1887_12025 [Cichorium endivia]|nr:hypothetical protein L1887_12025 [Cichorium endivia]